MEKPPFRVMLIAGSPEVSVPVRELLSDVPDVEFTIDQVESYTEGLDRLTSGKWDVIFLDLHLPEKHVHGALAEMAQHAKGTPILGLTDLKAEDLGADVLARGAYDYLILDRTDSKSLAQSLRAAIETYQSWSDLKTQSFKDQITDLYNRQALLALGGHWLALANRTDKELVVIYIDILDMGEINREYGREVGDRVLHEVGESLRGRFRQDDIIGRIGNDNYVVLALIEPAVTENLLMGKIPRMIEISPVSDPGPPNAHLSMGLARHNPAEELTLKELIDLAEQNLKAL